MYQVYVLENPCGRFYIGHTSDLDQRIENHNRVDVIQGKYTRKNGPWRLVWTEAHPTRGEAIARERQIKQMKSARWIRRELLRQGSKSDVSH